MKRLCMACVLLAFLGSAAGSSNNVAAPFAPDPGLLARYLLTEHNGTTVHDVSGHRADIALTTAGVRANWAPRIGLPAWTADGGLSFGPGAAPLAVPAAVQGVHTVEVVIGQAANYRAPTAATGTPRQTAPVAYGRTRGNAPMLLLSPTYWGSPAAHQGVFDTYVSPFMLGATAATGTLAEIDGGIHVLALTITASGAMAVSLDGVSTANITTPPPPAAPATDGAWTLGGTPFGLHDLPWSATGFRGTIYGASFSNTLLTPAQIAQDARAWRSAAAHKGANLAATAADRPGTAGPYLGTIGESLAWGHGLPDPEHEAFTQVAVRTLGAGWEGDQSGNDAAGASTLQNACVAHFMALDPVLSGPKIAVIHDNGNAARGPYPTWPDLRPSSAPGATAAIARRDLAVLGRCAQTLRAHGWLTVLGEELPSGGTGAAADANQKDITNLVRLTEADRFFDAIWDETNDARLGADGAATSQAAASACVLDGTRSPTYVGDNIHLTACGQSVLGQQLAALVSGLLNRRHPPRTVVTAAAAESLAAMGGSFVLSGSAPLTFTLAPCGGLPPGTLIASVANLSATAAMTVAGGTEYNAGARDSVGPDTGRALPPGAGPVRFVAQRGTQAAGGCRVVAQ